MKYMKTGTGDNYQHFRETIQSLPDSLFDGHTVFAQLPPSDKLMWLSQAAQFYYGFGGKAGSTGRNEK